MQVRGHTLVWATDSAIPQWLLDEESSISAERAKSLLKDYIFAVVGRYRGKITWWDVLDEAIDDVESNGRPFNLRDCFWLRKLGPDFVKDAFVFANQADTKAKLYYNDYHTGGMTSKANNALALILWARSQGAPIHGVGMQWHIDLSVMPQPGDEFYQNAQRLTSDGFDIMVSGLDVSVPLKDGQSADLPDLKRQADVYRAVARYALHFSPRCRALITWGFTDRYSSIPSLSQSREGAALPSDVNYQPKPAYWSLQEEVARLLPDDSYLIMSEARYNKCLEVQENGSVRKIQLGSCANDEHHRWKVTWLADGTFRLSLESASARALDAVDENQSQGEVRTNDCFNGDNQKWVLAPVGKNLFRLGPRNAWWRALTVDMSSIVIHDYREDIYQQWNFIRV